MTIDLMKALPLASIADDLVPLLGVMFVFSIPLVAILTSHQRKMAELVRKNNEDPRLLHEVEALKLQVHQLRHQADDLTVRPDSSPVTVPPPPPPYSVEQRLNG